MEQAQKECRALSAQQHFVYIQLLKEIEHIANPTAREGAREGGGVGGGGGGLDYKRWEVLYQCRAVLAGITGSAGAAETYLECARAARNSGEFHPASRFLRIGKFLLCFLVLST